MSKDKHIVEEHDEIRHLEELDFYPDHQSRYESSEFRHVKEQFHKVHAKCFIDNGYCKGNIEIHHNIIEWAMNNGVDWEKVKHDFPNVDSVDDKDQMMVLCSRHHRGKYTGIHTTTYPEWISQKYMNADMLAKFESKVNELLLNKN